MRWHTAIFTQTLIYSHEFSKLKDKSRQTWTDFEKGLEEFELDVTSYRLDKSDLEKPQTTKGSAWGKLLFQSSHYTSHLCVLSLWTLPVESYWPMKMSKVCIYTKYFMMKKELRLPVVWLYIIMSSGRPTYCKVVSPISDFAAEG